MLDVGIDRQLEVRAVDGVLLGLAADDDLPPGEVLVGRHRTVAPGQLRLVEALDPVLAGAVVVDEAEQVRGERDVRGAPGQIGAPRLGLEPDAGEVERPELVGDRLALVAGDVGELGSAGEDAFDPDDRPPSRRAERPRHVVAVGDPHLVGGDHDRVDRLVDRQRLAVAVVDEAARGRQLNNLAVLRQGVRGEAVMLEHLPVDEPAPDHARHQQRTGQQPEHAHPVAGVAGGEAEGGASGAGAGRPARAQRHR